jgi:hypothetical protein
VALGTRLRTGDVCIQTGIWRVPRVAAFNTPVVSGNAMPAYHGQSVIWELIQAFCGTEQPAHQWRWPYRSGWLRFRPRSGRRCRPP